MGVYSRVTPHKTVVGQQELLCTHACSDRWMHAVTDGWSGQGTRVHYCMHTDLGSQNKIIQKTSCWLADNNALVFV